MTGYDISASSAIRAMPAPTFSPRRRKAAFTSAVSVRSAGSRAGLSGTPFAHALMSGSDAKDADARYPSTCMRAQSAGVFEYGDGGHNLFFSLVALDRGLHVAGQRRPEARESRFGWAAG